MAINEELLGLLKAAASEPTGSLHSGLGRWRQRVGQIIAAIATGGGEFAKTWAQVGYVTTEAGPPPNGPGQVAAAEGDDVIFTDTAVGNVPYDNSSGVFTLQAGKTYDLSATFMLGFSDSDAFVTIYWVDADSNLPLRDNAGHLDQSAYNETGGSYAGADTAKLIYPVGDAAQEVKLRIISLSAGTLDIQYGSNASVVEI